MTLMRSLSPARRRKVAQIRHALAQSDAQLHHLMKTLDAYELDARQSASTAVRPERIHTLDLIHLEMMSAVARLEELNTGLLAQEDIRRGLLAAAQGYTAWSYALSQKDLAEIAAAQARVKRHFDNAADLGERGATRLDRGV